MPGQRKLIFTNCDRTKTYTFNKETNIIIIIAIASNHSTNSKTQKI